MVRFGEASKVEDKKKSDFFFLVSSKMPSPESNLLNTSLEQLKKQEAQGRVATEERMTRLL